MIQYPILTIVTFIIFMIIIVILSYVITIIKTLLKQSKDNTKAINYTVNSSKNNMIVSENLVKITEGQFKNQLKTNLEIELINNRLNAIEKQVLYDTSD